MKRPVTVPIQNILVCLRSNLQELCSVDGHVNGAVFFDVVGFTDAFQSRVQDEEIPAILAILVPRAGVLAKPTGAV